MTPQHCVDAAIVGGGPAGSAVGRLLASWGHDVVVFDKGADRSRGLAESLPPSTIKLLTEIGVLDAIERAGFYRTRGNTAWWASSDPRVETFGSPQPADTAREPAFGYQVFRPAFDRVLLERASAAGARVEHGAQVRAIHLGNDEATIEFSAGNAPGSGGAVRSIRTRYVVDCSGRAGVLARRFRTAPEFRTFALVGSWHADAWDVPDPTHTIVETFAGGWAWSVPLDEQSRHVGVMIGRVPGHDAHDLAATYRALLGTAPQMSGLMTRASLRRVWACDASLYSSTQVAGPRFVLAGDAASFIDPLSSFGVKKALASAWVAAAAVHTALSHPARAEVAFGFFSDWERRVYETHLSRSREFARAARGRHDGPFWSIRADASDRPQAGGGSPAAAPGDAHARSADIARDPAVQRAFERLKDAPHLDLVLSTASAFEPRPIIRGHEIVVEPALAGGMRFFANVDLLALAKIAPSCRYVPDVFEAYCRHCPPVPLPSVLGGLSVLLAKGVLHERA